MEILLVEDNIDSRTSLKEFLCELGHDVKECSDGEEALELFKKGYYPLVLSDIKMPRMSGIELLRAIKNSRNGEHTEVVLFTGYGDMESAIEALRAGAYDYLLKPINVEELALITERIAEHQALKRENRLLTERFNDEVKAATEETRRELKRLKKIVSQSLEMNNIGFFSKNMKKVVEEARKYHTDRSIPVLIQGETGSGKEVIAKIIHYGELEDVGPFVDINCASLNSNLFESELFGYEAGTFTGGLNRGKKGKLDLANGGTLFLDEIAEMPLESQGKFLRVLQEKEFFRVGGLKKIKTDVRIICATNVDLMERVKQGLFRKDLYYRLKVGHIIIPPLRQRKDEIVPLALMFLKEFSRKKGKRFNSISSSAARILLDYSWPGNVRELKNAMEWVVFMFDDVELKPHHLGILTQQGDCRSIQLTYDLKMNIKDFALPEEPFSLKDLINKIVYKALQMHNGNKTETARYLGISRRSLYTYLKHIKNDLQKMQDDDWF